MSHHFIQTVSLELMIDHHLAAPTRVATSKVSLAITIAVKQRSELGILQLGYVGNAVFVGSDLVDEIALGRAGYISSLAVELGIIPGLLILVFVERIPVESEKGRIAAGDRGITHIVIR